MKREKQIKLNLKKFSALHVVSERSSTYIDIWGDDLEDIEVPYLIEHGDEKMLHRSNIAVMQGKPKQGKSTGAMCFVMALLAGEYNGLKAHEDNTIVMWVDTEMGKAETRKRMRHMVAKLGMDKKALSGRIIPTTLKTTPKVNDMRLEALENDIKRYSPDLVVLDGIADLAKDFNKSEDCFDVLEKLGNIVESTGIALLTIIHENKQDENAKGHMGAACGQKAYELYAVKKEQFSSSVKYLDGRGAPCTGFQFAFDDNGIPIPTDPNQASLEVSECQKTWEKVIGSLPPKNEGYTYTELVTEYMRVHDCKDRGAKKAITSAVAKNVLIKECNLSKKDTRYKLAFSNIIDDEIL